MKYLICHAREIRTFFWVDASSEEEAIAIATDLPEGDVDESDQGEFEIREVQE